MPEPACILVVEDDPDMRRAMELLLEAGGFAVALAEDGEEAMEVMQERKPDLMLLDVMLAHILEGLALAREMAVRPEWADIPIIIVSSIKQSEYAEFYPDSVPLDNIVRFLAKPVDPPVLIRHIREALQSKPASGA